MPYREHRPERVRTALFVDFDNIFIRLKDLDPDIARAFGENQESWLGWLAKMLGNPYTSYQQNGDGIDDGFRRKILVRRCYLNPQAFAAYRPYFIRSGFEVIDCPQLTSQGKTSTDIHLVIDVLDTLYRTAEFDEFIILSGDADFTPLLLRLRMHDRRTVILSAGYASAAYKASSDYIIPTDVFILDALGFDLQEEDFGDQIITEEVVTPNEALLKNMADHVYEAAEDPSGVQANHLPFIYRNFQEFVDATNWLGYNSLRRLTEEIVSFHDGLTIIEEDPWCVARIEQVEIEKVETGAAETKIAEDNCDIDEALKKEITGSGDGTTEETGKADIRQSIANCIQDIVAASSGAVTLADLAWQIKKKYSLPLKNNDWFGAGGFKLFLKSLDLGHLKLSSVGPSYLFDPDRCDAPADPYTMTKAGKFARKDIFLEKYKRMALLASKIHQFTDAPYLVPEHYRLLFDEIAREVNEKGYHIIPTSKKVRDRCVEKGAPVSRAIARSVLMTLSNSGSYIRQPNIKAEKLAEIYCERIVNLCNIAQLGLNRTEVAMVEKWITGKDASEADQTSAGR